MYINLYLSISICIYLYLSIYIYVSSISIYKCIYIYISIYISESKSIYLSIFLSPRRQLISLYSSIYLSICLSIYLSIYLYLSIYFFVGAIPAQVLFFRPQQPWAPELMPMGICGKPWWAKIHWRHDWPFNWTFIVHGLAMTSHIFYYIILYGFTKPSNPSQLGVKSHCHP